MPNPSILPSSSRTYSLARYSGPANPVGNVTGPTRETAPLASDAGPRVMHPRLNGKPWSTSMAIKRKQQAKPNRGTKRKGYNGA